MLSAIAGSMTCAGGVTDPERRERQRDAVAEREGGDDQQQPPHGPAEQEQPDDEEDVVGADGDVMDARRGEGLEHRDCPLPRAGVEVEAVSRAVQDLLPDEPSFSYRLTNVW